MLAKQVSGDFSAMSGNWSKLVYVGATTFGVISRKRQIRIVISNSAEVGLAVWLKKKE